MFGLFVWLLSALLALASSAEPTRCEMPNVEVNTQDQELHARTCAAATSAYELLKECQLQQKRPIAISFFEKLSSSEQDCLGLYHQGNDQIDLLFPKAFRISHESSDQWSAIPVAEHFDSIVVHELTHALVDQNALVKRACSADEEYIAYAIQLATLSRPTRNALIDKTGVTPPVSQDGINQFVLGLSPSSFAVRSWLHFQEEGNGCNFVGKIIRGEASLWIDPE